MPRRTLKPVCARPPGRPDLRGKSVVEVKMVENPDPVEPFESVERLLEFLPRKKLDPPFRLG